MPSGDLALARSSIFSSASLPIIYSTNRVFNRRFFIYPCLTMYGEIFQFILVRIGMFDQFGDLRSRFFSLLTVPFVLPFLITRFLSTLVC